VNPHGFGQFMGLGQQHDEHPSAPRASRTPTVRLNQVLYCWL
jgi:hypothetical protein